MVEGSNLGPKSSVGGDLKSFHDYPSNPEEKRQSYFPSKRPGRVPCIRSPPKSPEYSDYKCGDSEDQEKKNNTVFLQDRRAHK